MTAKPDPRPPTSYRDLYIDGNVYVVPREVFAHFQFLHALIDALIRILNRLSPDSVADRLKAEADAERVRS